MFFVIVSINLIGIWTVQYLSLRRLSKLEQSSDEVITTNQHQVKEPEESFEEKILRLEGRLDQVEEQKVKDDTKQTPDVLSIKPATQPISTVIMPSVSQIKEQTAYIGSGSSSNTNWTDIDSATIELNSYNYPNLKKVVFEANLSIVGGEAFARLKNKTSGQVIEISTVSHNSSTPAQKLSGPFGLTSGSNEYIVQLRSSSNEKVTLDSARLRLFYQ